MELRDHILQVREGLKSGRFPNEASVSQGVVLRLLQALDWPIFDARTVCPEYALGGGRVDFALCHPPEKPAILVEVKKVGQTIGADRQVFEYAFHAGVPMALLTDGQEWHFYLPAEQGAYQDRRVYRLDLVDREVEESERRLKRYLDYKEWSSGTALESARSDYRDVARSRSIHEALSEAWAKLLEEQDDSLLELVADRVENICGFRPELDVVASFLSSAPSKPGVQPKPAGSPPIPMLSPKSAAAPEVERPDGIGFSLNRQEFAANSAKDVLIKVLEELTNRDRSFPERFAARPKHARIRRYIARDKAELYPGRPDLCEEHSYQLRSGWWIGTNYSRKGILKITRMAAEVAGIAFGRDLIVNVGQN